MNGQNEPKTINPPGGGDDRETTNTLSEASQVQAPRDLDGDPLELEDLRPEDMADIPTGPEVAASKKGSPGR